VNSCPICNSSSLTSTSRGRNLLLHCNDCDVHVLMHPPEQDYLDSYYSSEYIMSKAESLASEHRRIFRFPEQYWLISQLQEQGINSGSSVLDIGCDKGYFIDQCRRFGYSVTGVEPSISARSYCESVGLKVYSNLKEIHAKFDAITMWHVLEHFTNPHGVIADCEEKLHTGGFLFIRVPDFASFWSSLLGKAWIWFQPNNHYVHYSKMSLTKLIESHGFDIISCTSRKPNDMLTKKSGLLADKTLNRNFGYKQSFKKYLGRLYEHFTGVELFLIARKK